MSDKIEQQKKLAREYLNGDVDVHDIIIEYRMDIYYETNDQADEYASDLLEVPQQVEMDQEEKDRFLIWVYDEYIIKKRGDE